MGGAQTRKPHLSRNGPPSFLRASASPLNAPHVSLSSLEYNVAWLPRTHQEEDGRLLDELQADGEAPLLAAAARVCACAAKGGEGMRQRARAFEHLT